MIMQYIHMYYKEVWVEKMLSCSVFHKGIHWKIDNTFNKMNEIFIYSKTCDKERFDKEQIGVKKPFPVSNYQL